MTAFAAEVDTDLPAMDFGTAGLGPGGGGSPAGLTSAPALDSPREDAWGEGDDFGGNATRAQVVAWAKQYEGVPYVWGGTSTKGWDCSGFTQKALRQAGVNLPRISAQQARFGKQASLKSLRPGDLVAWDNSSRNVGADHIALYIGNGYIMEAPGTGKRTRIRKLGRDDFAKAYGVALDY